MQNEVTILDQHRELIDMLKTKPSKYLCAGAAFVIEEMIESWQELCKHSLKVLTEEEYESRKKFYAEHWMKCGNEGDYIYRLKSEGASKIYITCPICDETIELTSGFMSDAAMEEMLERIKNGISSGKSS